MTKIIASMQRLTSIILEFNRDARVMLIPKTRKKKVLTIKMRWKKVKVMTTKKKKEKE